MKCPKCGGKLGVYRTVGFIRYRKCKECSSKFKSYEKYRIRSEEDWEEFTENAIKRIEAEKQIERKANEQN